MLRTPLFTVLPLALSSLACSAALSPPFTPPEEGGPPWTEVRSPHFVLRTDLDASDARDMIAEFEQMYAMFEDIAFPFVEKPKGRTSMLVFRDEAEYNQIAPRSSGAFFVPRSDSSDDALPSVYLFGDLTNLTRLRFQHELTHRFVHFYYPTAPPWLNEGLAQYFSTMVVEDGKAILGRSTPDLRFRPGLSWDVRRTPMWVTTFVPAGAAPTIADLLASDRDTFHSGQKESEQEKIDESKRVGANYAAAWALVHLLQNGPPPFPEQFELYLSRLGAGKPASAAWKEAFASIPMTAIQRAYETSLVPIETKTLQTSYTPREARVDAERTMAPEDVHLLWAAVHMRRGEAGRGRARADIDAAARLAKGSPDVKLWRARLAILEGRYADAERDLKSALEARPTEEKYMLQLFQIYSRQVEEAPEDEARRARLDALASTLMERAASASALNDIAWYLGQRGRVDEALPLALRAVEASFSCYQCLDTLAYLLFKKGAVQKAFETQSMAMNILPDRVTDQGMLDRYRKYRKALADADAPAPAP